MTEASSALEARARHWIIDAGIGAAVALGAITAANAALPDRPEPAAAPPTSVARLVSAPAAPATPAAAVEPAVLIAFRTPVAGEEVVSPFGLRQLPWEENGRLHEGVDIAADFGAPVLASADGVVTRAGQSSSYGRFVELVHAEGLTTLYAHMGAVADGMRPGRAVAAGTVVGKVGSSGTSTGPHLHFEVRDARDRPLNPTLFMGRAFASADDLPLTEARRFPRRVRMAFVSRIPESKKLLMQAKLERKSGALAADAPGVARDAGVTVRYGDGRPRATIRFNADRRPVPAYGSEPAPRPPSLGPAAAPTARRAHARSRRRGRDRHRQRLNGSTARRRAVGAPYLRGSGDRAHEIQPAWPDRPLCVRDLPRDHDLRRLERGGHLARHRRPAAGRGGRHRRQRH
ncbi:M23 family metallopeptidase [Phenylobacterium sp. J367]|uniref:M23 family metallopeptidase n=1 Tax=Phenylobacterium sp. J367 TaxID=2898435 RepID=UPI002151DE05|nr:M23 family metallopeptidase [Phenylobacterium sp. J367]MCR5878485.1 M23 family metallopeptidase [Phenylobacterium sp. J367]